MLSPVPPLFQPSRRERQIMDVLFRLRTATAAEIRAGISDPPSYTAVRTMLRILEDKGIVTHTEESGKYVYAPAVSVQEARASAVRNLLDTFFSGSAAEAAVSLLGSSRRKLTRTQIDRLARIVEKARKDPSDG